MTLSVREIALLFISFQSLMFAVILFSSKGPKRLSNLLLAIVMIVLGVQMAVLLSERFGVDYDSVLPYLCLFGFAYGPLLYTYTQSVIYKNFKLEKRMVLHVLPFLIMLFSALFGFGLCSSFGSLFYISLIAYSTVAIKDIFKYRAVVKQTQSSIYQINLSWLQWTLIVFTVTFLLDIYQHFYQEIDLIPGLSLVYISLLVLINGMFYKGLKQPMIFQGISAADEGLVVNKSIESENTQDVKLELETIRNYMDSERPFTDPNLTLNDLSELVDITPRRLSSLINRHFNQNFMDYINTHRIELAKQRLKNPIEPKETILEVMYEVGFNSKSSFNTLFKQKTGHTPSDFKKLDN